MNQAFYLFPIRLNRLMAGQPMPTCGLGTSIAQALNLLLHTRYRELRSDRSYGCEIWDIQFDHTISFNRWSQYLCDSLEASIRQHEPRLKHPLVSVSVRPLMEGLPVVPVEHQRLAVVTVQATLSETEESFRFSTSLTLGPMFPH